MSYLVSYVGKTLEEATKEAERNEVYIGTFCMACEKGYVQKNECKTIVFNYCDHVCTANHIERLERQIDELKEEVDELDEILVNEFGRSFKNTP